MFNFTCESKKSFWHQDNMSQDTVGSAPLYSTIGGNSTDGEYCKRYNDVGYSQHQQAMQQSGMTNHKPWKRRTASALFTTGRPSCAEATGCAFTHLSSGRV